MGKGVKLVSEQEQNNRLLENTYTYKLKDPVLDSRLYGREATMDELEKLGITSIAPYKKVIIFDLHIESHKQQANKVCLPPFLGKM